MKFLLPTAALLTIWSQAALADHTLAEAMANNPTIARAVNALESASGVTCLTESSEEFTTTSSQLVTQVATCSGGNEVQRLSGKLSVTYFYAPDHPVVQAGEIMRIDLQVSRSRR